MLTADRISRIRPSGLLTLAVCAVASIATYALGFVRPSNLLELQGQPHVDLFALWRVDPWTNARLLVSFLILGVMQALMIRAAASVRSRLAWLLVLGGAAVAGFVLLFQYPFGADDIFDNILRGRMIDVYGANPYHEIGAEFPSDPFFPYAAWVSAPSVYGPAWELTAALATRLGGMSIVGSVLAFKGVVGLFLAGSIALVASTLRKEDRDLTLGAVIAVAWNPILLFETLGNGHNDMAMVFWILAAAWAVSRDRYSLAVVCLVIGALFKLVPLMLLPVAILLAFRNLPDRRRRLRFVLVGGALTAAVIAVFYAPFWRGPTTLGLWWRADLFTSSLPAVIRVMLEPALGTWLADRAISWVALVATFAFATWVALRPACGSPCRTFAARATAILLFFLLVTCPWRMQWYSIWPLAIAALLPPGPLPILANLLAYTGLANQFVVGPLMYWNREAPPPIIRELAAGPAVLLPAWLHALAAVRRARRWAMGRPAQPGPAH
jgi:hypothetical protein